ncbi:helicase-exonuclease AddAB subunit AddA [Alteribacillus sp. YIM 98480]|uniref:helicase-exonuclease AddAB subunit AddA n=1 Tax=Alteribacillus sp. YIM 98480 TaxID=2606599 RepID=UPI00131D9947|nr:helicase-exonuclease AddAB subunit AddA [Alteribacillus sp. YIM 98480]
MKMKWKPKPDGASWTDSQWEAISGSGSSQLVSAAAGSGKTAVLVERIINKITDKDHPADVDRLLIVTFTNAAAAEMKNRIAEALEREINKSPGSLHLRRQLALLNRAQISTLHSFCMSLIRKYYYKVNIDPKFRILDEIEGELMREEILDEVFEEQYSKENNTSFIDACDRFSGDKSDEGFRNVVRNVYRFSRAHPDPDHWLSKMASYYNLAEDQNMEELEWVKEIWREVKARLSASIEALQKAKSLCELDGGPAPYLETIAEDEKMLETLHGASTWEKLYNSFQYIAFKRLKTIKKNEGVEETLKAQVKDIRDKVKKEINSIKTEAFDEHPHVLLQDIKEMAVPVQSLVNTVRLFAESYQAAKEDKGLVDFSDLEHLCLAVLNEEDSEAVHECRYRFEEILVDEYQDTNHTQEAILQTISNGDNLFLVGDVKQSVYRFRLAEPGLFLEKYQKYNQTNGIPGWKVDLDQNFRSRTEVLSAANFIFKQLMDEKAGDVKYDEAAELKAGNKEYQHMENRDPELVLINKGDPLEQSKENADEAEEDTETAQLEARWMAGKIKQLINEQYQILDKETKQLRNITYRDVVILMRSMPWASTIMEEFKKEGLPVYAELSGGYFQAVEINIMLSLLQVIDNPRQDIPLASVLRSPIVGMNEEELAQIRLMNKKNTFFDALKESVIAGPASVWKEKALLFYEKLRVWRERARSESLSEFIWDLLQETGYYDFAGGLPGGKQRQANLLALYDRARSYEKTSFRGLFRFLRFIERIQERGDDLGTARALGEQEDVIRLMTIHKSKGLEFPVVFIAGLNKQFNFQDVHRNVLLHKELGIGAKSIDPNQRVIKESIPQLAVKKRIHRENIAEEMRVLYVAMTRAKEKLILVGTLKKAEKTLNDWLEYRQHGEWILPEVDRLKAKSYADWIGPALFRHHSAKAWQQVEESCGFTEVYYYPSNWKITFVEHQDLQEADEDIVTVEQEVEQALKQQQPVNAQSEYMDDIEKKLSWSYPYQASVSHRSKQTVSEYKRTLQDEYSEPAFQPAFQSQHAERPLFMQQKNTRPAERGTAVHTVMEHIPLETTISKENCQHYITELVYKELLSEEQANMVEASEIVSFFSSSLGERMKKASQVFREIPFSYGLKKSSDKDLILIQGAVDCVFRDERGQLVLIDYKTDAFKSRFPDNINTAVTMMKDRYQSQMDLYLEALSNIWQEEIQEAYLYAFDGHYVIDMMN